MKYNISLLFLFSLGLIACNTTKKAITDNFNDKTTFRSLASTIQLDVDTTYIVLSDIVDHVGEKVEVLNSTLFDTEYNIYSDSLMIVVNEQTPIISTLLMKIGDDLVDVVVLRSPKIQYIKTLEDIDHKYKTVSLVGDINAWNPANTPMKYYDGYWIAQLELEPDVYAYQVVVDGDWILDPDNSEKMENGMGGWNSKMVVSQRVSQKSPILRCDNYTAEEVILHLTGTAEDVVALWQNSTLGSTVMDDEIAIKKWLTGDYG